MRTKIARDCTLGAALIRGADRTRFGTLQTTLENQFCNGKDEYPTDLTSAYGMHFPNLGEVWFNPASIANILSLSLMYAKYAASPWTRRMLPP